MPVGNAGHSGAVCPGLIEAGDLDSNQDLTTHCIPGQSAPASLKHCVAAFAKRHDVGAFRGSLPRPH